MYRKNIHTAEKKSINLIADSIGFHLIVAKQRVETAKPLVMTGKLGNCIVNL